MVAPVRRILVLTQAVGAERESFHGGPRAVVGQFFYDREAWAAVDAGYERVFVAPVTWVEHLAQAIFAEREIRRYHRWKPEASPLARGHLEACELIGGGFPCDLNIVYPGEGRLLGAEGVDEFPYVFLFPPDHHLNAGVAHVADEASEVVASG